MALRDEILLDAQVVGTPKLSVAEQRIINVLTKTVIGGTIIWTSLAELSHEIHKYRTRKKDNP